MRRAPAPNITRIEALEQRVTAMEDNLAKVVWAIKKEVEKATGHRTQIKPPDRRQQAPNHH